jgi:acetyl-CoA synthetase
MSLKSKSPTPSPNNITSVLHEDRVFKPSKDFSLRAHVKSLAQYQKLHKESIANPEAFWSRMAKKELVWFKPFKSVLKWKAPDAQWFVGGKLNLAYNCLDKHLGTPTAQRAAIIWEGEPAAPGKTGEERTLTYQQLHREVCLFANVLKRNGIKKGDRIIIYLPMVPEAAIAMLACARIGAIHSVVFGGFSAQSVADRSLSSAAPITKSTSRKTATSGGTANSNTSTTIAPPKRWIAKMSSSFFTPAVPPANPKASSTPPPATFSAQK